MYDALNKYGIDFTANAEAGKLDPVIGRDDEIRRAIQILSRRTKNNPVLIGDPGVGYVNVRVFLSFMFIYFYLVSILGCNINNIIHFNDDWLINELTN
jgi:hypothetical protein